MRPSESVYNGQWDQWEGDEEYQRPPPKQYGDPNALNDVFLYEPPKCARDIPRDAVPECYIELSRICTLPDLQFIERRERERKEKEMAAKRAKEKAQGKGKKTEIEEMKESEDSKPNGPDESSAEFVAKYKNVNTQTAAKGSIMTLSFHVKKDNVIKLYLYWNGQCIRFMPEDVRDLLPVLFNMNYRDNAEWIRREGVDRYINELKDMMVDVEFAYFQHENMQFV